MTLFRKDGIFLIEDEHVKTSQEVFEIIGEKLISLGIVGDEFIEAIKERESKYPTGLETQPFAIAIPHTEIDCVNESCLIFVKSKTPIEFFEMVNNDKILEVNYLFFIIIKDREKQVSVIQDILEIATNEAKMVAISEAKDADQIYEIISG